MATDSQNAARLAAAKKAEKAEAAKKATGGAATDSQNAARIEAARVAAIVAAKQAEIDAAPKADKTQAQLDAEAGQIAAKAAADKAAAERKTREQLVAEANLLTKKQRDAAAAQQAQAAEGIRMAAEDRERAAKMKADADAEFKRLKDLGIYNEEVAAKARAARIAAEAAEAARAKAEIDAINEANAKAEAEYAAAYAAAMAALGVSANANGVNVNANAQSSESGPLGPSTNITVLKSLLRGMGFNSKIIDSSSSFLMSLLSEGLDYDNAISIFLNSKDYTLKNGSVVASPFYQEYGFLNEGLVNAKSASELYNFVEGSKGIIDKYGLSSKFLSTDSLKKYVKNNVTVKDLDERANAARLKAINADPAYVQSLKILGFLGSSADLTDFYLDPTIGKESLELKRSTGAFTAEALRRANAKITTDKEDLMRFERITAGLQAKGLGEAQIGQAAGEGFENIAQTLAPSVALSNIFEGKQAATAQTIQQELEAEQFMGTASERRKKLKELGTNIFDQSTGMARARTTTSYSNYSNAGQI